MCLIRIFAAKLFVHISFISCLLRCSYNIVRSLIFCNFDRAGILRYHKTALDLWPQSLRLLLAAFYWGRTGFDWVEASKAACRGWYVGLVNHRTKTINANEELALAA